MYRDRVNDRQKLHNVQTLQDKKWIKENMYKVVYPRPKRHKQNRLPSLEPSCWFS